MLVIEDVVMAAVDIIALRKLIDLLAIFPRFSWYIAFSSPILNHEYSA